MDSRAAAQVTEKIADALHQAVFLIEQQLALSDLVGSADTRAGINPRPAKIAAHGAGIDTNLWIVANPLNFARVRQGVHVERDHTYW